jgi:formamidopyrimidine-DNA glycosylase
MPELPEVETIRRGLQQYLKGHSITSVEINYAKIFEGDPKFIIGGKILKVRRFGKIISIDLSNKYSLYVQVKLTGQLLYRGPNLKTGKELSKKVTGGIPGKHTHAIIHLDKKGMLYYNDVRKFGRLKVIKTEDIEKHGLIGKMGPEPFNGLTAKLFLEILSKSSTAIKVLLMNQNIIAGIGNIYANDACYFAKIHPKKPANKLSNIEKKKLYDAIISVLKKGIEVGGASELSYVKPDGTDGSYQKHFLAYDKKGELCERCKKEKFVKIVLGGRGTYFCPYCQKL